MNQIQIVRQPHTKGLLTRYTGKKIQEKQVKTQFERFGGIGVSILAVLLLVYSLLTNYFIGFTTVLFKQKMILIIESYVFLLFFI